MTAWILAMFAEIGCTVPAISINAQAATANFFPWTLHIFTAVDLTEKELT